MKWILKIDSTDATWKNGDPNLESWMKEESPAWQLEKIKDVAGGMLGHCRIKLLEIKPESK